MDKNNFPSSLFYQKLIEDASVGIVIFDRVGNCIKANNKIVEILGLPENHILANNFHDIEQWKETGLVELADGVLKSGKSEQKEVLFITSLNKMLWLDLHYSSFFDGDNRYLLLIANESTKRKEEEKTVSDALEFNKLILESAPVGIATYASSGQCISVNDTFVNMIGGTKKLMLLQNFYKLQSWKEAGLLDMAKDALKSGNPCRRETHILTSFGKEVWLDWYIASFDLAGEKHLLLMIYDIMERKIIEKNLREKEETLSITFNATDTSVLLVEPDGKIIEVNNTVKNGLLKGRKKYKGVSVFDFLPPIVGERRKSYFAQVVETKKPLRVEDERNGVYLDTSYYPIFEQNGAVEKIAILALDITERKRAELELKKSEERFRTSVESFIDPFAILKSIRDSNGKIIDFMYEYINQAGCKEIRISKELAIGKKFSDILPKRVGTKLFYDYCNVIETEEPLSIESLSFNDNYSGQNLTRAFNVKAVKLDDGLAVTWVDITEKKEAEIELIESEARYKTLAENIPGAINIFDKEMRYILAEGAGLWRKGYPKETFAGKTMYEVMPQYVCDMLEPYYKALFEGKESYFEAVINNTTFEVRAVPLKNSKGEITAGMSMFHDISKLKQNEEKLLELNRNKDKFFSILSHDLKSPFTALLGFSEYLVDEADSLDKSEIKQFSSNILSASKNIYNLLDNLLQWSSVQTGRIQFDPEVFEIKKLLTSLVKVYEGNIYKKKIQLAFDVDDHLRVNADSQMVSTIIRNLLSNAIKFTPSGGKITIESLKKIDHAEISIIDSGIGISEDDQHKLFKIEESVKQKGTDNETGTGLGLIICKEFAEKNNGAILLESKPGKGSKFTLTLPLM